VRFEVLVTVDMKFMIFWDVTPCILVDRYLQSQIFGIDEISEKCIAVTQPLSNYQCT